MEYKTDSSAPSTSSKCQSKFRSDVLYSEINYWILGMPTYRNWEIAHDWDYQRIGFTPTSKSRAYRYAFDNNQQDSSFGGITGVSSSQTPAFIDNYSDWLTLFKRSTKSLKYVIGF
jgi:hypothetical protein